MFDIAISEAEKAIEVLGNIQYIGVILVVDVNRLVTNPYQTHSDTSCLRQSFRPVYQRLILRLKLQSSLVPIC